MFEGKNYNCIKDCLKNKTDICILYKKKKICTKF